MTQLTNEEVRYYDAARELEKIETAVLERFRYGSGVESNYHTVESDSFRARVRDCILLLGKI